MSKVERKKTFKSPFEGIPPAPAISFGTGMHPSDKSFSSVWIPYAADTDKDRLYCVAMAKIGAVMDCCTGLTVAAPGVRWFDAKYSRMVGRAEKPDLWEGTDVTEVPGRKEPWDTRSLRQYGLYSLMSAIQAIAMRRGRYYLTGLDSNHGYIGQMVREGPARIQCSAVVESDDHKWPMSKTAHQTWRTNGVFWYRNYSQTVITPMGYMAHVGVDCESSEEAFHDGRSYPRTDDGTEWAEEKIDWIIKNGKQVQANLPTQTWGHF